MLKFPYLSYVQGRHIPSCPFPVTFVFFSFFITLGSLRDFFSLFLFSTYVVFFISKNNNTTILSWVDRGAVGANREKKNGNATGRPNPSDEHVGNPDGW